MVRFNLEQRRVLVEKVPDVANIAAGALVFGQLLGAEGFSPALAVFGSAIWLVLIGWSLFLVRERRS